MTWLTLMTMLAMTVTVAATSLNPIRDAAAAGFRRPVQYFWWDIAGLLVAIQLILGGSFSFLGPGFLVAVASAPAIALFFWSWWLGVQVLSKAGVVEPWRRAAFIFYVLPFSMLAISLSPWLLLLFMVSDELGLSKVVGGWFGLVGVGIIASTFGCCPTVQWILSGANPERQSACQQVSKKL